MQTSSSPNLNRQLVGAIAVVVIGVLGTSMCVQTWLSSSQLSANFISGSTRLSLIASSGNSGVGISPRQHSAASNVDSIDVPFSVAFIPSVFVTVVTLLGGTIWLKLFRRLNWIEAMVQWGLYGWSWWCFVDLWEWLWIAASAMGWSNLANLFSVTPQFWLGGCLAGWLTTFLSLGTPNGLHPRVEAFPQRSRSRWLYFACAVYIAVFTTMNWRLYANLLVPHGDSAMYEEHLWNLLHGKGFRSYLDRGLFFGEHIQFVHLFLLPLYVIWPSHLLLEACSSTALALGAFPVYWMVRRHTGSDRTALAVAAAYLLYSPLQFLDIEIDLKTFRPESFGIPLLLLTLDQLDRKSLIGTLVGMAFCLTVKEDYAIIFGPLGIWIAVCSAKSSVGSDAEQAPSFPFSHRRSRVLFGLCVSLFSVAYLWLATRVLMPWFRSGVEVHYFATYFARFGDTPNKIIVKMVSQPWLVVEALATLGTALYAIALLAPLAFLPLLAPSRLAVGLPLFAILCLIELEGASTPQHQFHAPLVAIVFWSLAAALPRAMALGEFAMQRVVRREAPAERDADGLRTVIMDDSRDAWLRHLVWTSSLSIGLFFSLSPLGIPFWDAGSLWHWQKLYGPSPRAEMFAPIAKAIPETARVASTDFVHPRFTHYERSYDYSRYHRVVNAEGESLPDDTDYLVIDTQHRYSKIKTPQEVPEFRDHPDRWELIPDETKGYFIMLKRRTDSNNSKEQQ